MWIKPPGSAARRPDDQGSSSINRLWYFFLISQVGGSILDTVIFFCLVCLSLKSCLYCANDVFFRHLDFQIYLEVFRHAPFSPTPPPCIRTNLLLKHPIPGNWSTFPMHDHHTTCQTESQYLQRRDSHTPSQGTELKLKTQRSCL